tara:strand:+ start:1081 stop:1287 length:207 start_codon:yes stop_codon:yes gene_type:complete
MVKRNFKEIGEQLNQLACRECTKGWLEDHDNLTQPITDIIECFNNGFITEELKDRLLKEVNELKMTDL